MKLFYWIRQEWLLCAILLIAIMMRLNDLTHLGYMGDMVSFNGPWAQAIQRFGLFQVYATSPQTNYPPIFLIILWITSSLYTPFRAAAITRQFTVLTKIFSTAAELALIVIIYRWLPRTGYLKWLITLILALYPGLIATTAFWGQTDSILTLFLVLTIVSLNRDRLRMSWVWYALAFLMKFQAIVLLPMLGILSLRRYGIRSTIVGILIAVAICVGVYAPFVVGSGFDSAMRPYNNAVDLYPVLTANAFNLWYLVTPSIWSVLPAQLNVIPYDTTLVLGILTLKQVGLILFGGYVLLVVVIMWRNYSARREFVWATALYLAFFTLPTQIHERYLYPAAVLSVAAIAQDRRVWPVALGLLVSYTFNIVVVPYVHFYWFGIDLKSLLGGIGLAAASINVVCLLWLMWVVVRGKPSELEIAADKPFVVSVPKSASG